MSACVAETISPIRIRTPTTSAAVCPVLAATSCGLAPRGTFIVGRIAPACAGASVSVAAGAGAGASSTTVVTWPLPSAGAAASAAGAVSGSAFRRGFAGSCSTSICFGFAPETALPPDARRRATVSSGTDDDAVRPE